MSYTLASLTINGSSLQHKHSETPLIFLPCLKPNNDLYRKTQYNIRSSKTITKKK